MPTLPRNSDLQGIPGVQGAPGRDGLQGAKVKYLSVFVHGCLKSSFECTPDIQLS